MARTYNPKKRRAPRRSKAGKRKAADRRSLSRPEKREVLRLVRTQGETKRTMFYQGFNDGTTTTRSNGLYNNRGWAVQNNAIIANSTDILQLIPYVLQGADDFNRIGQRIQPTSLTLTGSLRVRLQNVQVLSPYDFKVYIYICQHVSLKDYTNLYANNNFNQFLENGEGNTVKFNGEPQNVGMPIAKQYYRVLKRKVVTMRYAGAWANPVITSPAPTGIAEGTTVSVANCHSWYADYSMNLTKHIPKTLMYPETSSAILPTTLNSPTNSSLFMAMGYVDFRNPSDSTTELTTAALEQTYVATLNFKDM